MIGSLQKWTFKDASNPHRIKVSSPFPILCLINDQTIGLILQSWGTLILHKLQDRNKYAWVWATYKDPNLRKRHHKHFRIKAKFQFNNSLRPRPPSCFGLVKSQAIFAPTTELILLLRKNELLCSISLIALFGSKSLSASNSEC